MIIKKVVNASAINGITTNGEVSLYQDGKYNELLIGFKNAVDKYNTSVVLIFDGRSGMGKTMHAVGTGFTLDDDFGLHKIHFSPKTFLEGDENGKIGLANAQRGDFIIFDEAMIISNRSAMSQINKMIIQAMSMIRSKNIYVAFCVNSIFDLDKNLVLHRADALIHVYGESLIKRGSFCAFFKGKDGIDRLKGLFLHGKKYYDYSKPRANFIGRFTKKFIIDENLYEQQKQKGINDFLHGSEKKSWDKHKSVIELRKLGMKVVDIARIVSLDKSQVWRILRESGECPKN